MLFSLSHGRIYDQRLRFVERTDSMPLSTVRQLNEQAMISLARDEATVEYLRNANIENAVLGGCPTILLSRVDLPRVLPTGSSAGTLLSLRNPQLMSIPQAHQGRLHKAVVDILGTLDVLGLGPVRIVCHDSRDVAFASSFENVEYIVPDDVYSHLALLRAARLVVTFRLHSLLPSLSFGTPDINISYDERSISLVKTIGYESWDIDYVKTPDLLAEIRDRCSRLSELTALRAAAEPRWRMLEGVMRENMATFAARVKAYASDSSL
jgi:polysaccharide pyruvyl transferase WcaK-like protein